MGMVLSVEKLVKDEACPIWESMNDQIGFDVAKYVDDRTFVNGMLADLECEYKGCTIFYCCGVVCNRPKDLDKAIEWVTDHIKTERGKELKKVLEIMKHDEKLYFGYS